MVYLWQGGFVFIGISWLVYLFVSRIAQNLLANFFLQNSVVRWHLC